MYKKTQIDYIFVLFEKIQNIPTLFLSTDKQTDPQIHEPVYRVAPQLKTKYYPS